MATPCPGRPRTKCCRHRLTAPTTICKPGFGETKVRRLHFEVCHPGRSADSVFAGRPGTKDSDMRHKVAGWKLGRNTSHRRSLLRNLVTSLILEERIETTVPKAKAMRPRVEKMITLGKRGDLAARRQAHAYLMTTAAVDKLFETIGPRFGDREGGFLRIVRLGWRKGDGADKVFVELLGSEKLQEEKRQKRVETRAKRAAEMKKSMEESEAETQASGASGPAEDGEKKEKE